MVVMFMFMTMMVLMSMVMIVLVSMLMFVPMLVTVFVSMPVFMNVLVNDYLFLFLRLLVYGVSVLMGVFMNGNQNLDMDTVEQKKI